MLQLGPVEGRLFDQNEPETIYTLQRFIQIARQSGGGRIAR